MGSPKHKNQPQQPSISGDTSAPATLTAEAGLTDTIARNRVCSPVPAQAIPVAPDGYQPTDIEQRRRALRLVARDQEAEVMSALDEIAANEANFKQDLGDLAPDAAPAKKLASRLLATRTTLAALESLVRFHRELEDIALSDALLLIEATHREYTHRVDRMPQLALRYPALVRFFAGRSATIADGIARTRTRTRPAKAEDGSSNPA